MKRSHREVVAVILVDSKLPTKIGEREKGMGIVEMLLILAMAAFYLAVVHWCVRPDELVMNAQIGKCRFKQRRDIALAVGKAVCCPRCTVALQRAVLHECHPLFTTIKYHDNIDIAEVFKLSDLSDSVL